MMSDMNALKAELDKRYEVDRLVVKRPDSAALFCRTADLPDALAYLRDHQGYVHLNFITCIDRLEEGEFELVYMVRNHEARHDLALKTRIPRENPVMESVHGHWAAAATYQRELRRCSASIFPDVREWKRASPWKAGKDRRLCAGISIQRNIRKKHIFRDRAGKHMIRLII
jgi:Ni,Fe-hydrogenase III component G